MNQLPIFTSTLFQERKPRFSLLRLHPKEQQYYVVDDEVIDSVRLYGSQQVTPYTLPEAESKAECLNALAGYHPGTYELSVRQATDPHFRDKLAFPYEIEQALESQDADLLYACSGGKDSDAMTVILQRLYQQRGWKGKRAKLHSDTGITEWLQTGAYVARRAELLGLPLLLTRRSQGDLITEMYERHRTRPEVPPFPSAEYRWCTADQKTSQGHKAIRRFTPLGTAVCCLGIRREESPKRAKAPIWSLRESAGCSTRRVYDWHPLFFFTEKAVWEALDVSMDALNDLRQRCRAARARGEDALALVVASGWRYHVAYPLGARRMSCSCCFLATKDDVKIGAYYNPEAYRSIVQLEILSGFFFFPDAWLGSLCPELLSQEMRAGLTRVMHQQNLARQNAHPGQSLFPVPVTHC